MVGRSEWSALRCGVGTRSVPTTMTHRSLVAARGPAPVLRGPLGLALLVVIIGQHAVGWGEVGGLREDRLQPGPCLLRPAGTQYRVGHLDAHGWGRRELVADRFLQGHQVQLGHHPFGFLTLPRRGERESELVEALLARATG